MMKKKTNIKEEYFKEAGAWDEDRTLRVELSEKRAWFIAKISLLLAMLAIVAVVGLTPLKTIEPFVIRVDSNTGYVDVVSTINETTGEKKEEAQVTLDKYWLAKYIRHREAYLWDTRDYDRYLIGLLSDVNVQQQYSEYTNPKINRHAPVSVYGQNSKVEVKIKGISVVNPGEMIKDEYQKTVLVRYTKKVSRAGEQTPLTHWVATISFVYRNSKMKIEDRLENPLGFQVTSYRNDQESVGG